jgi:hypothetical protein
MARSLDEAGEPRRIASGDAPEAKPIPGALATGSANAAPAAGEEEFLGTSLFLGLAQRKTNPGNRARIRQHGARFYR